MLPLSQSCRYQSVKVLQIQSVWVGTLKNIFLVAICIYICFALVSDKLYQRKESVISSVHTKVKGIAEVTENVMESGVMKSLHSVFDTADYTFPLQGNSFFVMTNFLKSEGQEQKLCPEYPTRSSQCHSDQKCKKGWMDPQSKGIQTGKCIPYDKNRKTCEVFAWCPAEEGKEAPRRYYAVGGTPTYTAVLLGYTEDSVVVTSGKLWNVLIDITMYHDLYEPITVVKGGWCYVHAGSLDEQEVELYSPSPLEYRDWEPEKTEPMPALLRSAENFTVLIKNNIDFPGHNYTTRNILPDMNVSCTFHKIQNPQCPIFRLGDIFQEAGENFSEVAIQGGIMGIEIYWDCNLDSWSHHCYPKYSFRRLDDKYTNESLIPGYNFRYAKYYKENNVEKRTLIKAFGVRFDILVFGTGGKFDIIQLVVYIGSTLSYFGLATVFIDFLINTYSSAFCRSRVYPYWKCCEPCAVNEYYYRKKYESVMEPKPTLKYVSFVDEPHIWMVDQQLLGKSLQVVKGQKIPRPQMDIMDLSRLSPSLHDSVLIPGQPEELQLLREEVVPKSKDSPGWCQCGNCLPSRLPENRRALEELCCRRKPGPCITTSELFRKLVLTRKTLQLLLLYQEPLLVLEEEAAYHRLRHCAYRCYTIWRFGSQDMADFAILPSCCRWRIRKEFPKTEGQYSGFKYPY